MGKVSDISVGIFVACIISEFVVEYIEVRFQNSRLTRKFKLKVIGVL